MVEISIVYLLEFSRSRFASCKGGYKERRGMGQESHQRTVKINMKRVARIGSSDGEKVRPVIVNLGSEDEKTKLFGNLKALKGLEEYKGISVCEDWTPNQHKEFKALTDEVKEKKISQSADLDVIRPIWTTTSLCLYTHLFRI